MGNNRNKDGTFRKGIQYSPNTQFKKGRKLSEEERTKMMGRVPWNKGKKRPEISGALNPFYGKKHTKEAKEKNRQTHLGKKANENQLRALGLARTLRKGQPAPWARNNPQIFKEGKYILIDAPDYDISVFGETYEEAIENLRDAFDLCLEDKEWRKTYNIPEQERK